MVAALGACACLSVVLGGGQSRDRDRACREELEHSVRPTSNTTMHSDCMLLHDAACRSD